MWFDWCGLGASLNTAKVSKLQYFTKCYTTKVVNMYFIHENYLVTIAIYLFMKATNVYVSFSHMQTPCLDF